VGIQTSKEDMLKLVSQNLLSKTYLSLDEIENLAQIKRTELNEFLEELNEFYSRMGIILEIIEFDEKQFVIVSLDNELEVLQYESSVYSILTILAHLVSIKGNYLPISDLQYIISEYSEEIEVLEQNGFIIIDYSQESPENIQLSPSGANLISSVVPKFQDLLLSIN
jgi:hypothetical protein